MTTRNGSIHRLLTESDGNVKRDYENMGYVIWEVIMRTVGNIPNERNCKSV